MNTAHHEQLGAYEAHQRQDEDSREIDKRALLGCASRLKAALDDGGRDIQIYADAIRLNQRLWTMFQVALCDPDNQLPKDLKLTLLNLSRYIDRVSFNAVAKFTPHVLNELINLNRTIAAGLAKKPAADMPPVSAVPTEPMPTSISISTTA